jgi:hypothetical protein
MSERTPVISLGAGVQSSTMLLMAAEGRFGVVPELAIFADTLHEPKGVYEHLEWLREQVAGKIEIAVTSAGDLLEVATQRKFNPIPLYMRRPDGKGSVGRRQCTKEFKLYPIRHELRRRGFSEKNPVDMWVGISMDEIQRMKPTGLKWVTNSWPLIEARMSRTDCLSWFHERYPDRELAKSACVFCPYKRVRDWAEMRDRDPESWKAAVAADEAMRDAGEGREQFVSSSLVPLRELRTMEDEGQTTLDFNAECEGLCGV